jgi:hypothetical protein
MRETTAAPTPEQSAEREGTRYETARPGSAAEPVFFVSADARRGPRCIAIDDLSGGILTRHDDVLAMLRDPRLSSQQRPLASDPSADGSPMSQLPL